MAVAVIKQMGVDCQGHYVTVVRKSTYPRSDWWVCNDRVISTVSQADVSADAVAILYRRVPSAS